jgi:hypothetical protein
MNKRFAMQSRLSGLLLLISCSSSTPGARPHDMSAARHEQTARDEEQAATAHGGAYDPAARTERKECRSTMPRPPICWTTVENPTADHLRAAEEHRRRAADHRAASAALRNAEAHACAGIADDDRDTSPFDRTEDIVGVTPLKEEPGGDRSSGVLSRVRMAGAVVTFRARPGMTAEWLQRIVDCHLARNTALGHVVPEMPDCPLVPKGISARVTSTGNGFAVAIRSDDPEVAREVLDRAQRSQRSDDAGPVTTKRQP